VLGGGSRVDTPPRGPRMHGGGAMWVLACGGAGPVRRPPVRRPMLVYLGGAPCGSSHAAERPPVRRQSGGAAPRAAACGGAPPRAAAPAGYGPRPMLVTGPAVARPSGPARPREIRDGLEGGGPVSPPAASAAGRCRPLTAGRPLTLAAVDREPRLAAQGAPAFALSSHYM
jgi:hypothetical protein